MSTFTDWNGPQGGGARALDLIQLANAYAELVTRLNQHMADRTPGTSDVHGIKTYVESQIAEIKALIPSVAAFITETAADAKYALKTQIPSDTVSHTELADYAKSSAVAAQLANYLKTNDLGSNEVITAIQADIDDLEATLAADTFEKPVFKATEYVEGLIHAVEQVKFTDKIVATVVGGSDANGKYWLIGMQTDEHQAGIALIKYGNTKPFSAIVNFVASKADGKYNGALTVVTDTVINGLKFKLVYGTGSNGNEHVYLAIQAPGWLELNQLEISASGINFCPIGSEGCMLPNGDCHDITDCFTKVGLSASSFNVPIGRVGDVIGWSKFNSKGVPVDFPSSCHACDGSTVNPATWPELIAKGITNFPLVDYHIIVGSSTESKPDTDLMFSIKSVANGTGTITLNKKNAEAGETILVELDTVPVTVHVLNNASGTLITVTQIDTTNVYTFKMPAADVTVIIDFA